MDRDWPQALRSTGDEQVAAVNELRAILLRGLRTALYGHAIVGEAQLEDFVQEALVRILQRLDQFAGRSKFTTWAHAIAVNAALAELRRKRWQDVSLEALIADGEQLSDPVFLPDRLAAGDEDRTRLLAALRRAIAKKLTGKQRAAILGELRELPFDQVAHLLGTNRNAAYKLVHDARRALKRHLIEEGISGADVRAAFVL